MKQFIIFITITALAGCFGSEPQKTGKEGKPLPEFKILLTDNSTWFNTASIIGGKPIVLFYFSPYCPFCKAQTQTIIENMNNLKDIKFYFISDYPISDIKGFSNKYKLSKYTNITIGMDSTSKIKDYFEITAVPYLAIYRKDKTLNNSFVGKVYTSQLKKAIE